MNTYLVQYRLRHGKSTTRYMSASTAPLARQAIEFYVARVFGEVATIELVDRVVCECCKHTTSYSAAFFLSYKNSKRDVPACAHCLAGMLDRSWPTTVTPIVPRFEHENEEVEHVG